MKEIFIYEDETLIVHISSSFEINVMSDISDSDLNTIKQCIEDVLEYNLYPQKSDSDSEVFSNPPENVSIGMIGACVDSGLDYDVVVNNSK